MSEGIPLPGGGGNVALSGEVSADAVIAMQKKYPRLQRWPLGLARIESLSDWNRSLLSPERRNLYEKLLAAAAAGYSDDELDDIQRRALMGQDKTSSWDVQYEDVLRRYGAEVADAWAAQNLFGKPTQGAQPTQDQWLYNLLSPEQREQFLQMQLGGQTPWQQQQWQASQDAAARAYDLQNRQFAWQQEQAARAEEERRKERVATLSSRPRDWATLWSMYGGEGLPVGYNPPALEAGVPNPSWAAALQGAPRQAAPTGGYAVPTTTPLPGILRGALEGRPVGGSMFRMPEGAGVLPSAQYLSKMPGTALEGLAGVYGKEFGLSWDDIVQAIQRSLPQRSAGQVASLGALRR